ncbi:hypothetical protein L1987_41338 [Smallanthus sonchifolius]|uniref:Uncharacterized protein n=1 Tax=Smallanthus sonchifolius TaxID=185202 RepID=A0ACB9GUJ5_9ASTR|nr:hypothetical protein L1987_41338 [Smallanthus sonchifolius]
MAPTYASLSVALAPFSASLKGTKKEGLSLKFAEKGARATLTLAYVGAILAFYQVFFAAIQMKFQSKPSPFETYSVLTTISVAAFFIGVATFIPVLFLKSTAARLCYVLKCVAAFSILVSVGPLLIPNELVAQNISKPYCELRLGFIFSPSHRICSFSSPKAKSQVRSPSLAHESYILFT